MQSIWSATCSARSLNGTAAIDDLVGHIGGDDYVVLTDPDSAEMLARDIIETFDSHVPELYDQKDLEAGFIIGY